MKTVCPNLPNKINLLAIECDWDAEYRFGLQRQTVREYWGALQISLAEPSVACLTEVMKRWLSKKARFELTPWLNRLSRDSGLDYRGVFYRGQKTVWGTCTQDGKIGLNYKLLFLPPAYVEYVLVHELAHTVCFNHSKQFWALVECRIENWREMRYLVRRAEHFMPSWLL